jgi:tryptophan 2,3-dioxygenase
MSTKQAQSQPNYWEYIRVEELLSLQGGLEGDERQLSNDEVMFITVHQVYELWFKLLLRELTSLRNLLKQPVDDARMAEAVGGARRCSTILRRAVDHFEIMETLTTRAYLAFRDKLTPASGFQSAQMRQLEILLGLPDEERLGLGLDGSYMDALRAHGGASSPALERVRATRADRPNLREAFQAWLYRTPIDGIGPEDPEAQVALDRFLADYATAHGRQVDASHQAARILVRTPEDEHKLAQRFAAEKRSLLEFLSPSGPEAAQIRRQRAALLFILTYCHLPLLAWPQALVEAVIELEQHMVIFRQRHARMVERVIGRRVGTGGSSGVDYLDQTAQAYRVFRDLWSVRTFQIRADLAPPLQRPAYFSFAQS